MAKPKGLHKPHKHGNTFDGHLWVVRDDAKDPVDISAWTFTLEFFATETFTGDPAWSRTTAVDPGGLELIDGDERQLLLCSGATLVLTVEGFEWIVSMVPAIPPLAVGTWYWRLRSNNAGRIEDLETGRFEIVVS